MARAKAQNSAKQPKRKATRGSWPKGQSGNPGGRPKDGTSFASVLKHFLAMTGPQVAKVCKLYAKQFTELGDDVDLRGVVALRWIMSIIDEPTPGLLQQLVDRVDGPVPSKNEHTGADGGPIETRDAISDDERISRIAAILGAARARRDGQAAGGSPADPTAG